jgi:hypothetical protein
MSTNTTADQDLIEQAKQELLALHARDRQAHFATDADALVAPFAESIIDVRNGAVQHIAREDKCQDFAQYFKNAAYQEWDDLEPPIVRVSQDASLGWVITQTKVHRTQVDESGTTHAREFIYAGIMTYEKQAGYWICTANVSTFEYLKT